MPHRIVVSPDGAAEAFCDWLVLVYSNQDPERPPAVGLLMFLKSLLSFQKSPPLVLCHWFVREAGAFVLYNVLYLGFRSLLLYTFVFLYPLS